MIYIKSDKIKKSLVSNRNPEDGGSGDRDDDCSKN